MLNQPLLEVHDLHKTFAIKGRNSGVRAVNAVSFQLNSGQTLGVVGESGSGKSTLGRLILRLVEPTSGSVKFDGVNLHSLDKSELRKTRREMQMVFQDPMASLDPRKSIHDLVIEPLVIHKIGSPQQREEKVVSTIEKVGLERDALRRFPHEFSGGQRQRISIARAIITTPKLLIADEPVSALDVSIRSHILNLLLDFKRELNLTYVFISHDLEVVQHLADVVCVMYLGKIVETATAAEIFANPKHPYTQALISAIPKVDPNKRRKRVLISGDIPSPANPPSGCQFHPRCPQAMPICSQVDPITTTTAGVDNPSVGHRVACHLFPNGETTN